MNDALTIAADYLSPSVDALWRWSEDGRALVWADGKTIAFRQEVEAVLERLAPVGLPPFGAVVLLLGACRDGWETSAGRETVAGYMRAFHQWQPDAASSVSVRPTSRLTRDLHRTLDGLDAVSRLSNNLRHTSRAKAILAETVFEQAPKRLSVDESSAVVRALADGISPEALAPRFNPKESLGQFTEDASALQRGLSLLDAEALALRAETGLDEPIDPADFDLPAADRARRLIANLRSDEELSGVARVAQDLMAAVHVPRALHAREELPLGGVSDLSNRGPLDRLLLSELAHDELTLAVRVALNEALYLRRESPPRNPPRRRAILLDCGVRMWGIPRVFGISAALAMAASSDPRADVVAFRASDDRAEPIELTRRAGLVACMAALEADPHPGKALRPFLEAVKLAEREPADIVLITHPDVLADGQFRATLVEADIDLLYVATVERGGQFRFLSVTPAGRRILGEASLNLDALTVDRPKPTPLLSGASRASLPAIFSANPFPLRLPCVIDPKHACTSQTLGLVGAAKDGRLLHWTEGGRGARQLTASLPRGIVRGVHIDDPTAFAFVVIDQPQDTQVRVVTGNLNTGRCHEVRLRGEVGRLVGVTVRDRVLYAFGETSVEAFDPVSGQRFGKARLPDGSRWISGRFFQRGSKWFAVGYDGLGLPIERVPLSESHNPVMIFDRPATNGPWAIFRDGSIIGCATGQTYAQAQPSRGTITVLGVSPHGDRIAVNNKSGNWIIPMDAPQKWIQCGRSWTEELVAPQIYWSTRYSVTVRRKLQWIYPDRNGGLSLVEPNRRVHRIGFASGAPVLHQPATSLEHIEHARTFERLDPPGGIRIGLGIAQWDDGSKAFLDSRGLLHLKSSDASVPELSLTLTDGKIAGWCSDGRVFGPAHFFDGVIPDADEQFVEALKQFVVRLR